MIQYKKILMTLALLLTAVTGAWADETPLVTINASDDFTSGSKTFDNKVTATFSQGVAFSADKGWFASFAGDKTLKVEPVDGVTITRVKFYTTLGNEEVTKAPFEASMSQTYVYVSGGSGSITSQLRYHVSVNGSMIGAKESFNFLQKIEVYGTAEPPIEVTPVAEPDANTKQWTFNQPGGDVVLTPIYAKAAEFATESTSSGVTLLAPAAAEGVIAGTDAPLIVEGTGIVAFAGTSNEDTQGTVMYAVTPATATKAPELDAADTWSADVPTAEDVADDGATVKVWYYILGADAPDGVAATLDNTFNNSDIAFLNVTVLSNKFDLAFKAANANTIDATDASKGTVSVKVGDAAAVDKTKAITDGKLKAVKMGSEVKLNTKAGYKFRKVEVKKSASTPTLKDALKDGATVVITYMWGTNVTTFTYTNNGGNYTGGATGYDAEYFDNEMSMGSMAEGTTLQFTASNRDNPDAYVSLDFLTDTNQYYVMKERLFTSFTISVNGTDITSQLTAVK